MNEQDFFEQKVFEGVITITTITRYEYGGEHRVKIVSTWKDEGDSSMLSFSDSPYQNEETAQRAFNAFVGFMQKFTGDSHPIFTEIGE